MARWLPHTAHHTRAQRTPPRGDNFLEYIAAQCSEISAHPPPLCGASTPSGHGIANVMRSGVVAAGAALETDLMGMIFAGDVLGDPDRLPPFEEDWDPWRESH